MTDNRILFWTLVYITGYWTLGVSLPDPYLSSAASLFLLIFGGLTFVRYAPETWLVVIKRLRDPRSDSAHLAAYGVTLVSAGSVYTGLFGLLWILAGQPDTWLATAISGFGRAVTVAGFALLFFSPDIDENGLHLPAMPLLIGMICAAVLIAGLFGFQIGRSEFVAADYVPACSAALPVKGSRSKTYHLTVDRYYQSTVPEACFKNRFVAEAAGYKRASN